MEARTNLRIKLNPVIVSFPSLGVLLKVNFQKKRTSARKHTATLRLVEEAPFYLPSAGRWWAAVVLPHIHFRHPLSAMQKLVR